MSPHSGTADKAASDGPPPSERLKAPADLPGSMGLAAIPALRRRKPYPEAPFELSEVTLTVDGPARQGDLAGTVGWLRRAREAGVTTFDTVDAPDRSLAETALARAFPDGDRTIVVLTPATADGSGLARADLFGRPVRGAGPRPPERPAHDGPATGRLHRLFEGEPAASPGGDPSPASRPSARLTEPAGPLVTRCRSADEAVLASHRPPPRVLSGPFSLLERTAEGAAERAMGVDGFSWIARDPFAGGRLDGSRFAPGPSGASPSGPRSLRQLEIDFASIATLGFLAKPGRRTLAQAALRFALSRPAVATVVIAPPVPERWGEILGFESSLPLTDDEVRRAEGRSAPQRGSAPGRGGPR